MRTKTRLSMYEKGYILGRFLRICAVALLLTGCYLEPPVVETDISELNRWVADYVIATPDEEPYGQSPKETLERAAGDCEDHAILLMWLYHEATGNRATFVAVTRGYGPAHAIVEWRGVWYDPTQGIEPQVGYLEVAWRMGYARTMLWATGMWTKEFDSVRGL